MLLCVFFFFLKAHEKKKLLAWSNSMVPVQTIDYTIDRPFGRNPGPSIQPKFKMSDFQNSIRRNVSLGFIDRTLINSNLQIRQPNSIPLIFRLNQLNIQPVELDPFGDNIM